MLAGRQASCRRLGLLRPAAWVDIMRDYTACYGRRSHSLMVTQRCAGVRVLSRYWSRQFSAAPEAVEEVKEEQEIAAPAAAPEAVGQPPRKYAPAYLNTNRKRWRDVDPALLKTEHTVAEAVALIQQHASANFTEALDVVMKLGVDPRRADQNVRGVANLPHNPGKTNIIAVFAEDEYQDGLREAGAKYVGAEGLMADILSGEVQLAPRHISRVMPLPPSGS